MWLVPFRYFNTIFRFPQSYSSEYLTLVVSNDTAVCVSFLDCEPINSKCATEWWNILSRYSSKKLPHLSLLLGIDGKPPGCPSSLSTILETCLGPSVSILSLKLLPPLSKNNKNPFLDNHVSFLYANWVCYRI